MSSISPPETGSDRLCSSLFALTLFLLPWIGVGLASLILSRDFGAGVQPALLTGGLLLAIVALRSRPSLDADGERVVAALSWTLVGSAAIWSLDDMGLAGDLAWAKSLKQSVQLIYFVALAAVPALLLPQGIELRSRLLVWERAISMGMLLAALVGLYLALAFFLPLPFASSLMDALGSNPSIAAGSDELYLGHEFVGIPRVRSGAAEPLYFGSYLLFALPVCALGFFATRGRSRAWRGVALLLGSVCLLLTFSRGVYLGLALQAGLLLLGVRRGILPRPSRRSAIGALALGIVGVGILATVFTRGAPWELPLLLWRRMAQSLVSEDLSNLTRLSSWEAAWRIYIAHPLGGVGWGGFGFWFFRAGLSDPGAAVFGWPVTNSVPLRVLAETGTVGALLWVLCLKTPLAPLRWLFQSPRVRSSRGLSPRGWDGLEASSFVLATCVCGMLIQILTFSQLNLPHLWLCLGLSAALARATEGRG